MSRLTHNVAVAGGLVSIALGAYLVAGVGVALIAAGGVALVIDLAVLALTRSA